MTTISSLAVRLFGEDSGLTKVFSNAEHTVSHFGKHVKDEFAEEATGLGSLQGQIGKVAGALGGMFSAYEIGNVIKENLELADSYNDMSHKIGVSTEFLSEMQYVTKLTGVEFEGFTASLTRMQKSIYTISQSKKATEQLAQFGLSVDALLKMKPEEQFDAIGKALDGIADPTQRTALATLLWGKAGAQNLQIFERGTKGLAEYREEAHKLGLTITKDNAEAADKADDALIRLEHSFSRLGRGLTFQLAGPLAGFANWAADTIPKALTGLIAGVKAVGTLIGGDAAALGQFATGHFSAGADIARQTRSDTMSILRVAQNEMRAPAHEESKAEAVQKDQHETLKQIARNTKTMADDTLAADNGAELE